MDPRGFHTITLGCKLNQFDTAGIAGELLRRGYRERAAAADAAVVVLNTCTVTGKADAEARKWIRRVRRENASCRLLVTGCYAELDAAGIAQIEGVDRIFGNRDKPHLPRILDELGIGADTDLGDRGCDGVPDLPATLHFGDRSRAFLKVQEGCRLACSYCVIPRVRGASTSVPPDRVAAAARSLFDSGYPEVVLTGVNVGDYGRDLEPAMDLAGLLRRLLEERGTKRIRLNSLEPLTITDGIVELMASNTGLAPHLQVPLQSGSNEILQRMRRNYRTGAYAERLRRLREGIPEIGLGADVIVGFPGETEERFRESYEFVAGSELNYLHVFAWSPRPGTPASDLPDRVHGSRVRERSARLRELGDELSHSFRSRFLGRTLDAVVLGTRKKDGRIRALTGNFIEVALPSGTARRGERIPVRVTDVMRHDTHAAAQRER